MIAPLALLALLGGIDAVELRPRTEAGLTYRVRLETSAHVVVERHDRSSDQPLRMERRIRSTEVYEAQVEEISGGRARAIVATCTEGRCEIQGSGTQTGESSVLPWKGRAYRVRFEGPAATVLHEPQGTPAAGLEHIGQWEALVDLLPAEPVAAGASWTVAGERLGWIQALVHQREVMPAQIRGDSTCTLERITETEAEIRLQGRFRIVPADPGAEGSGTLDVQARLVFRRDSGRPALFVWNGRLQITRILVDRPGRSVRAVALEQSAPVRAGQIRIWTEELGGEVRFD